jgi:hypothetical protein
MSQDIDYDIPGPIGIQDIDVEQSFTKINTNRTMVVVSLDMEGPYEPEIIPDEHTGSFTKVIGYKKPSVSVELETGDEDNPTEEATATYDSLKSFRADDLENRIPVLQRQRDQEKRYIKIKAEIERSKRLQDIIKDPVQRQAFLDILESVREELATND